MMHICVSKLTIIGSNNGLSPDQRQAIIWTNTVMLLTGPLGTIFDEILIEIHKFPLKKAFENVVSKMAAILSRPQWVKWEYISDQFVAQAHLTFSFCLIKRSKLSGLT